MIWKDIYHGNFEKVIALATKIVASFAIFGAPYVTMAPVQRNDIGECCLHLTSISLPNEINTESDPNVVLLFMTIIQSHLYPFM